MARPRTRSRLRAADAFRTAALGLRTRSLRAALAALGIAIGIAAAVAVLGISASSRSDLLAQLGAEGNLLTVAAGQTLDGSPAPLPANAPGPNGGVVVSWFVGLGAGGQPQQLAAEGTSMLSFLEGQFAIAKNRRDRS